MKSFILDIDFDAQSVEVRERKPGEGIKPNNGEKLVCELIKDLSGISLKDRCSVLEKFFEDHPGLFSDVSRKDMLAHYHKLRDARAEQAKRDINKRWHKDECAQTTISQYPNKN